MTTKKSVLRQLSFPLDEYLEAEEVMAGENRRLGLISRSEKINLKGFLPRLVADGLSFRKGGVYVPDDPDRGHMTEDQILALEKAQDAIADFNKLIK